LQNKIFLTIFGEFYFVKNNFAQLINNIFRIFVIIKIKKYEAKNQKDFLQVTKNMFDKKIAVVGAGAWGTALAIILSQKIPSHNNILLWCFEKETVDEIEMNRTNTDFLSDVDIPQNIIPVSDFSEIRNADIIVNAVPTQFISTVYSQINFSLENKIIVNAAKGIEKNTLKRISEIFNEKYGVKSENYAVISGPSHAKEVAKGTPTAVLTASVNIELAKSIRELFSTKTFRVYSATDVIGCELGGALKNVIAIAAGIVDGLKLGDNTKAALITRGLAEIARLGIAIGANSHTFSGLSGLGDLIVTCDSEQSRNRKVGELIAKGMSLQEIKPLNKSVAEGIDTTEATTQLAEKMKIEMPITEQIYDILYKNVNLKECINNLMERANKDEIW